MLEIKYLFKPARDCGDSRRSPKPGNDRFSHDQGEDNQVASEHAGWERSQWTLLIEKGLSKVENPL